MASVADCVNRLAEVAGITADENTEFDWSQIEEGIGHRLPGDYKALVTSLPDGWFRQFVRILRPEMPTEGRVVFPGSYAMGRLENMRQWRAGGHGTFPYPIYPEPGGLLPWGVAIRGALFFWLTGAVEEPERWPVITATAEWDYWHRFDGTVCEFLVEVAAGRYDASGFSDGPIVQIIDASGGVSGGGQRVDLATREPIFKPVVKPPPARPPSGTGADFWVLRRERMGNPMPASEFEALAEMIGPAPAGVRKVDWVDVQRRLGMSLPADYRAFIDTYGPGTFGDVVIAAPGASGGQDLFTLLANKAAELSTLGRNASSRPIYPESGGAISWGETAGGYTCAWAPTGSNPDKWGVVALEPDLIAHTYQPSLSFTAMLVEHKVHADQHPGAYLGIVPPRDPSAGAVRFTPSAAA
jgi:hypothetical protein